MPGSWLNGGCGCEKVSGLIATLGTTGWLICRVWESVPTQAAGRAGDAHRSTLSQASGLPSFTSLSSSDFCYCFFLVVVVVIVVVVFGVAIVVVFVPQSLFHSPPKFVTNAGGTPICATSDPTFPSFWPLRMSLEKKKTPWYSMQTNRDGTASNSNGDLSAESKLWKLVNTEGVLNVCKCGKKNWMISRKTHRTVVLPLSDLVDSMCWNPWKFILWFPPIFQGKFSSWTGICNSNPATTVKLRGNQLIPISIDTARTGVQPGDVVIHCGLPVFSAFCNVGLVAYQLTKFLSKT